MDLKQIKMELAKLLLKFGSVKTDKGILEFPGEEITEGAEVQMIIPAETEDGEDTKAPAEDGEYVTNDKVITVANSMVESIADKPVEEEKPVEEAEAEEIEAAEEEPVEEPAEVEEESTEEKVAKLREEVDEIFKILDSILTKIGETRDEADARFTKIEQMSASKPIEDEIENAPKINASGKLAKTLKFFE